MRALCLLGVLLFHSDFAWMSGGFLGVSTFFTLSGFLITSLLIAESERRGRVSIAAFWARRLRRLVPATLLAVAGVVATSPLWLPATQRERLTADALACLVYLVNWRFVSAEYAYTLIFSDPSPFQHFWSLAIEGQFYLVFPLVVGAVLALGAGTRGLAIVLGVLAAASVGSSLVLAPLGADDHIYYGTDTRASELLIGSLLALALRGRNASGSAAIRLAGPLALGSILVIWALTDVDSRWLYYGGFAGYALLSALVIVSAVTPGGIVERALSPAWLRWIGTVSYGAYLYHWPVFLVLDAERAGLGSVALFALRTAVTLGLAGVSYRFVEEPIRRGRLLVGRRFALATASAIAAVMVLALLVDPTPFLLQARVAEDQLEGLLARDAGPSGGEFRYGIFGDSTAQTLAKGLGGWLKREGGGRPVGGLTLMGCGILETGWMENRGRWMPFTAQCAEVPRQWGELAARRKIDLAVVLIAPWEVRNRRLERDGEVLALGNPRLDEAIRTEMGKAIDELAAAGTAVVWLTSPYIRVLPLQGKENSSDHDASRPERIDRLNELIREVVASRPDKARVVDFAAWIHTRSGGEFAEGLRKDDVHFTTEGAWALSEEWLGPEVVRAYRSLSAQSLREPSS